MVSDQMSVFAQMSAIPQTAYLAEMIRLDDPENFVLILAAGVAPENAERAGRAVSTGFTPAVRDFKSRWI